jgi:hypothetical protein
MSLKGMAGAILFSSVAVAAGELPVEKLESLRIQKHRLAYTIEFQKYNISSTEPIYLFGAKRRRFFSPTWYWGEAGYGALFGKRSGFIEGGVIVGNQGEFFPRALYDLRVFAGAGGGGSAPQGGGMIVQPTLGLGFRATSSLTFFGEIGYMHFINGDISSPSFAFSINLNSWSLTAQGDD